MPPWPAGRPAEPEAVIRISGLWPDRPERDAGLGARL